MYVMYVCDEAQIGLVPDSPNIDVVVDYSLSEVFVIINIALVLHVQVLYTLRVMLCSVFRLCIVALCIDV